MACGRGPGGGRAHSCGRARWPKGTWGGLVRGRPSIPSEVDFPVLSWVTVTRHSPVLLVTYLWRPRLTLATVSGRTTTLLAQGQSPLTGEMVSECAAFSCGWTLRRPRWTPKASNAVSLPRVLQRQAPRVPRAATASHVPRAQRRCPGIPESAVRLSGHARPLFGKETNYLRFG